PLQLICAIALLKQFVKDLWSSIALEKALTEPIQFNFMDSHRFIATLNSFMQNPHPLIQSLKFYFLKDLRARGLTMSDLRQFFNLQQETLPWLSDLPWNKDDDSRLPFNPYFLFREYDEAEDALSGTQLNDFLENLESYNKLNSRISFIGVIVARLFVINATRKLNENEKKITANLRTALYNISLSLVYKQLIIGLLDNENPILQINPRVDNKNLLIRLVIIHILAIHASLPDNHSPLTLYLHKLQRNTYILTCPSDEEAILMGALNGGFSWYECACGYKYVVTECGQTMQDRQCPRKCGRRIGGQNHRAASGQTRLNSNQIRNAIANRDKTGYIMETGSLERGKSVREMTASSYRILHLFVHTLIAFSAHSREFLNNLSDPIAHCLDHITKDWDTLKSLLNCNDEDLALILHDILHSITRDGQFQSSVLTTPDARTKWERQFTTKYVTNRAKNPTDSVMMLRKNLQKAKDDRKKKTSDLEAEINETLMTFDNNYKVTRLPRLWRHIGNTSFNDFRAYYENNEIYQKNFPFISVFFKYEEFLPHLKHLHNLVKFVRILSMCLNYRIKRNEALHMTFREFIYKREELQHSLKVAFDNFAKSWNAIMPLIKRYQCHDLPTNKPKMNLDCQVVLGLMEGKDVGLFLCAALEYLTDLQNKFLRDVVNIQPGTCLPLKFIEQHTELESGVNIQYHIKSVRLEDARQVNFINYDWNPKILEYSQYNLAVGKGQEISYDLSKIEAELVQNLVLNKTYLERIESGGLLLEPFSYCMEMFQGSTTILYDIKQKIKQEPIPQDKVLLLTSGVSQNQHSEFITRNAEVTFSDNESELLSALELLLCFIKRTTDIDADMTLKSYIQQWVKLSVLTENKILEKVLKTDLQLKHAIALYELVEEN
ncbi:4885_t:CDS:2, partial [Dentiscutata heterogama]